jgi:hypothetical protein
MWVDAHAIHLHEADDHPTVVGAEARDAVRAATNGEIDVVLAREFDRSHYVGDISAANDHLRLLVDHPVVDPAGGLVTLIAASDRLPMDSSAKVINGRRHTSSPKHTSQTLAHMPRARKNHLVPLGEARDTRTCGLSRHRCVVATTGVRVPPSSRA